MSAIRTDSTKVVYYGDTLINLDTDTVSSSDDIVQGKIGHLNNGDVVYGTNTNDVDSTNITSGKAARAGDLLSGQEAYVNGSKIIGSMSNNGDIVGYISTRDGSYTIPAGAHSGGGKVYISDNEKEKIIPENIKEGVTILGQLGTHAGATPVQTETGAATPSTSQQVISPTAGYYFSQFTVAAIPYSTSIGTNGGTVITIGATT